MLQFGQFTASVSAVIARKVPMHGSLEALPTMGNASKIDC
jgi:hypothetical protein